MSQYVLLYKGGSMPESEEDKKQVMEAWTTWFQKLGDKIKDQGNPFGPSKEIAHDGSVSGAATSGLSGYSILQADSLDEATELAKECPVVQGGASVEVYETFPVM
jgi:hypothetical protein